MMRAVWADPPEKEEADFAKFESMKVQHTFEHQRSLWKDTTDDL